MIRRKWSWRRNCSILLALLRVATMAGQGQAKPSAAVEQLGTISDGLKAVTAQTMRCVVKIVADTYLPEPEYYDQRVQPSNDPASSSQTEGSGILVSSDGYIVTNAHVVSGEQHLRVILHPAGTDIEERAARVIGIDKATDLAVLRIRGDHLPFLNLDDAAAAEQGEISLAFGDPFGMERSVTLGIVSAVDRQMEPDDPRLWIQTDAAVNPGNSGGPLVDARGHLLGINTVVYSHTGGNEGIALAIPASTVRAVFRSLVASGHVERVTLGLSPLAFTPGIAQALHLAPQSGILAEDVDLGGPADRAGLKPGDVLVSIDGRTAKTIVEFAEVQSALKPAVPVKINILRGNQAQTLQVTPAIDESDPLPLAARVNERNNLVRRLEILGVTLDADVRSIVGPTRYPHGVVIAARSSTLHVGADALQVRDIIYRVNGQEVNDVEGLRERLKQIPPGSPLVVQIERDHSLYYVALGAARE